MQQHLDTYCPYMALEIQNGLSVTVIDADHNTSTQYKLTSQMCMIKVMDTVQLQFMFY